MTEQLDLKWERNCVAAVGQRLYESVDGLRKNPPTEGGGVSIREVPPIGECDPVLRYIQVGAQLSKPDDNDCGTLR